MSTGLKANSDGSAAIQVGGTDVITLTSGGAATFVTSPTTVQAGTAAAPSITFSGDTNTGIYSPGADQVAIATGGSQRAIVDANGNVGVGDTSPENFAGYVNLSLSDTTGSVVDFRVNDAASLRIQTQAASSQIINIANIPLAFHTNDTERMRINAGAPILCLSGGNTSATGTGIAFPATQSASSDANTLDDYEEGTWTPSVGGTATYTTQTGKYTKIGNMVSIYCLMRINAIGTGSTTTISGLPFTSGQRGGGGMTYWAGLSQAVDFLYPIADNTTVAFLGATAASANPGDGIAIFQGGAYVIFSATYFV